MTEFTQVKLEETRDRYTQARKNVKQRLVLCAGTGCVANGAMDVHAALVEKIAEAGLDVETILDIHDDSDREKLLVSKSGCQGFCQMGPLLSIEPEGLLYVKVKPEDVEEIVQRTLVGGEIIDRLVYEHPKTGEHCPKQDDIPFYNRQARTVLANCGSVDAEDINEYIAKGGYLGARRAFAEMTDEAVCNEVLESGLRGRGGGGFPTGRKWDLTRIQPGEKKFVICNGDEGDPGAFMDRSVMEGNPHAVLEGMMIAARAVGADEGYVYVRMEYPLAVERVRKAVADAEAMGILGGDVFGTGKTMRIHVMEGAGAFVCGEETALIASIEGK
ncbi:MAG: NAD(P)H-dependent oxidoreductase subunit E, partial [Phycisphaerae bacterium]